MNSYLIEDNILPKSLEHSLQHRSLTRGTSTYLREWKSRSFFPGSQQQPTPCPSAHRGQVATRQSIADSTSSNLELPFYTHCRSASALPTRGFTSLPEGSRLPLSLCQSLFKSHNNKRERWTHRASTSDVICQKVWHGSINIYVDIPPFNAIIHGLLLSEVVRPTRNSSVDMHLWASVLFCDRDE